MDWFGSGGGRDHPQRDHQRYEDYGDDTPTGQLPVVPPAPVPPTQSVPPVQPAGPPVPTGPGGPAPAGRRRAAQAPVSRLVSVAVAGVAVLATAALAGGAQLGRPALAAACLLVQVAFVLTWSFGAPRAGALVASVVGVGAGLAADLLALFGAEISLAAFGYALAGGFMAAVAGQLLLGARRERVTDGLGTAMVGVVGAVAVPALLVLSRHAEGADALRVCLPAAGVGLLVARLSDAVLPAPRVTAQVPRGVLGVVLGGVLAGTAVGYAMGVTGNLDGPRAALAGLVVGLAAVLTELGVSFGTAALPTRTNQNRAEPEPVEPAGWPARYLLGPLAALTVVAPVAYVLGVLILLPQG